MATLSPALSLRQFTDGFFTSALIRSQRRERECPNYQWLGGATGCSVITCCERAEWKLDKSWENWGKLGGFGGFLFIFLIVKFVFQSFSDEFHKFPAISIAFQWFFIQGLLYTFSCLQCTVSCNACVPCSPLGKHILINFFSFFSCFSPIFCGFLLFFL